MSERELTEQKRISIDHRNMGTVNKNAVRISTERGTVAFYFSYETLVAVDEAVSENIWSKTTGKMLNELEPDKKSRIPHDEVLKLAQKRLAFILGFSDDRGEFQKSPEDLIIREQEAMKGVQ